METRIKQLLKGIADDIIERLFKKIDEQHWIEIGGETKWKNDAIELLNKFVEDAEDANPTDAVYELLRAKIPEDILPKPQKSEAPKKSRKEPQKSRKAVGSIEVTDRVDSTEEKVEEKVESTEESETLLKSIYQRLITEEGWRDGKEIGWDVAKLKEFAFKNLTPVVWYDYAVLAGPIVIPMMWSLFSSEVQSDANDGKESTWMNAGMDLAGPYATKQNAAIAVGGLAATGFLAKSMCCGKESSEDSDEKGVAGVVNNITRSVGVKPQNKNMFILGLVIFALLCIGGVIFYFFYDSGNKFKPNPWQNRRIAKQPVKRDPRAPAALSPRLDREKSRREKSRSGRRGDDKSKRPRIFSVVNKVKKLGDNLNPSKRSSRSKSGRSKSGRSSRSKDGHSLSVYQGSVVDGLDPSKFRHANLDAKSKSRHEISRDAFARSKKYLSKMWEKSKSRQSARNASPSRRDKSKSRSRSRNEKSKSRSRSHRSGNSPRRQASRRGGVRKPKAKQDFLVVG